MQIAVGNAADIAEAVAAVTAEAATVAEAGQAALADAAAATLAGPERRRAAAPAAGSALAGRAVIRVEAVGVQIAVQLNAAQRQQAQRQCPGGLDRHLTGDRHRIEIEHGDIAADNAAVQHRAVRCFQNRCAVAGIEKIIANGLGERQTAQRSKVVRIQRRGETWGAA